MSRPIVYLSGPMTGLSVGEAQEWRADVEAHLSPSIMCLNPLRGLGALQGPIKAVYGADEQVEIQAKTNDLALARDFLDTKRSDVILINLLGAQRVSVGTVMEIAWGYALQKPLVVAMEDGNVHEHCLINRSIDVRVYSVEDLWRTAWSLLMPGPLMEQ